MIQMKTLKWFYLNLVFKISNKAIAVVSFKDTCMKTAHF